MRYNRKERCKGFTLVRGGTAAFRGKHYLAVLCRKDQLATGGSPSSRDVVQDCLLRIGIEGFWNLGPTLSHGVAPAWHRRGVGRPLLGDGLAASLVRLWCRAL